LGKFQQNFSVSFRRRRHDFFRQYNWGCCGVTNECHKIQNTDLFYSSCGESEKNTTALIEKQPTADLMHEANVSYSLDIHKELF
jgi:hypothetical protein